MNEYHLQRIQTICDENFKDRLQVTVLQDSNFILIQSRFYYGNSKLGAVRDALIKAGYVVEKDNTPNSSPGSLTISVQPINTTGISHGEEDFL